MASFTGLAAARNAQLARAGWDVEADGLAGAPPLRVLVSEEISRLSVLAALRMLGLGARTALRVPATTRGGCSRVPSAVPSPRARGRRSSARRPGT